jgi:hypothetical protein
MLPRFLTRHVRSNQPILHERAQAITRAIPAPFYRAADAASNHTLHMQPALVAAQ